MSTTPVEAGHIIGSLAQAVARGGTSLSQVPKLIEMVLEGKLWMKFVAENFNKDVNWGEDDFEKFVSSPLPNGLETTVDTLKRLCAKEPAIRDAIDKAMKKPEGNPNFGPNFGNGRNKPEEEEQNPKEPAIVDNVNNSKKESRPTGNSYNQGMRRLRESAKKLEEEGETEEAAKIKKLHDEVLENKKSVHAAMVEAGFRRPTFTMFCDDPEAAAKVIFKKFTKPHVEKLIEELQALLDA